jgi:hypothetical protein
MESTVRSRSKKGRKAMKKRNSRFRFLSEPVQGAAAALLCFALFFPVSPAIWAQQQAQPAVVTTTTTTEETPLIPAEELDSLVAPIALYPDPLLAQTLAASTYPLEIVQLQGHGEVIGKP